MRRRDLSTALIASATGAALLSGRASAQTCSTPCYPQTSTESSAAADYAVAHQANAANPLYPTLTTSFPPGNVKRYGALGDGHADDRLAIQAAIDGCSSFVYFPQGTYLISRPLVIGPKTLVNLTLVGESRTTTYLAPMSVDITGPDGKNALIINKQANGKFSLSNLRFWSGVSYTGFVLYAEASADCQTIYSGSMDNCWVGLSNYNSGCFKGGLNNYRISNTTFEFMNSAFDFTSTTSDVHFSNIAMFNCTGFFVRQSTSPGSNVMSVNGLHAYSHRQGVLFDLSNCTAWAIHDVNLQATNETPTTNVPQPLPNLGSIGLFKFNNCRNMIVDGFQCYANQTFGTGALDTQITLTASDANFSNGKMDGCSVGILVQGAGSNDLNFSQVHCVNSQSAAFQVLNTNGTPSGIIKASNCNWSDGQYSLVLFTNSAALDFYLSDCRLVNAGLSGDSSTRNLTPATSGLVVCSDCIIGRTTIAAAADYYIDGAGSGSARFILRNTTFVGAPPAAIQSIHATQVASAGRPVAALTFSSSMTFDAGYYDEYIITPTDGRTFTINAPLSPMIGRRITVTIRNTVGTLGSVAWDPVFKLAAWTQPMGFTSRSIDFSCDGANWVEIARTPADVPI
jgi:hypothetical protein